MPKTVSETDAAYVAGLIDGEGCFCITRKKPTGRKHSPSYEAHLVVAMSNASVLAWLKDLLGGWDQFHVRKLPSGKQMYRWQAKSEDSVRIAKLLLPYLKVKRKQAELFIRFREQLSSYKLTKQGEYTKRISDEEIAARESMRLEMALLNA